MKLGKLPPELLERLLSKAGSQDPRVLLGPSLGIDAALIDFGDRVLVAKTDPITFATQQIGWYSVNINANDVACMGARPRWFLATLLLPPSASEGEAEAIFDQIVEACRSLEVTLVGGHTEVTAGLERPIVVGCMLGEVQKGKQVSAAGGRPGDSVVLTKGIAIEGTALLARDAPESLRSSGVSPETIEKAAAFLFSPGISVVRDAAIACASVHVHAMHDPTEGGLATGLWELARASGTGLEVWEERVPVLPECQRIAQALGLDPLGLLASGALLIAVPKDQVPPLVAELKAQGIVCREIGRLTPPGQGMWMVTSRGRVPLPRFERDELARFFQG